MTISKNVPYYGCQYKNKGGHYESYFLRANDPDSARAFWIRYTLFVSRDKKTRLGELWAIWSDLTENKVAAIRQPFDLGQCSFNQQSLDATIGSSTLVPGKLQGQAESSAHTIRWNLEYNTDTTPLLFLPEKMYKPKLPKAKSVVSHPGVHFNGTLEVDGTEYRIEQWHGSENHNWGSQHTDQYAWGQVTAFDNEPDAFLECITARVKIGPIPSPWLTIACLRLHGQDYFFNNISDAMRAKAHYQFFDWKFSTGNRKQKLEAHIQAPASSFAGLTYLNPPGGSKTCLNSKLARCDLTFTQADGKKRKLTSAHGGAFEILTDRKDHGVKLFC